MLWNSLQADTPDDSINKSKRTWPGKGFLDRPPQDSCIPVRRSYLQFLITAQGALLWPTSFFFYSAHSYNVSWGADVMIGLGPRSLIPRLSHRPDFFSLLFIVWPIDPRLGSVDSHNQEWLSGGICAEGGGDYGQY